MMPMDIPFFILLLLVCLLLGCAAQGDDATGWELIDHHTFDEAKGLDRWLMEGAGQAEITPEGQLKITNTVEQVHGLPTRASVFWLKTPHDGDLRIQLRCRAEPGSRVILFFNARTTDERTSLFSWQRPRADYADYAYEPRLELYTIGILRSDQKNLNLRYLGRDIPRQWIEVMPIPPGRFPQRYLTDEQIRAALDQLGVKEAPASPDAWAEITRKEPFPQLLAEHLRHWGEVNESFQKASIIANREVEGMAVFADPERWYDITVETVDNRITYSVDGEVIIDLVDEPRAARPLRGGHMALRNFRDTAVWYDDLKIFRRIKATP